MTALGGHLVTTGLLRGDIVLPGNLFSIGGVTHHGGQAGGCSPMRDIPRFVELLEKGQFDARTLATSVVPLERMLEGYEAGRVPHDDHGHHDGRREAPAPTSRAGVATAQHETPGFPRDPAATWPRV